ncbi:DUF3054 domain-containing protein [Microbacterium enclense]|uniref:DUF3054 domain-containing protein n=1 Tax=Microbacterium enclense TaxID=993073 RepID=A0A1G6L8V9_9MICO|nr:DUF3054 domain-containing protein [Microbacterium enclense]KSU54402.1 hypothetical protein AS029_10000 [Microbacterium enclense]MCM3613409.1 DUF3054 domain-containing protein [Microbacterium enclense]SDC39802.1 Protein of unknown function [Microbacterium enclense]
MTSARRSPALALVLDAVLVVVFAAIGRATHDGDVLGPFGSGLATTAWPFVAALLVGWLVTRAWRRPTAVVRTGLPVWAITVALGMVLRALSGQGVAVAFIIVATLTLALLLLGWRGVARLAGRRRTV